MAHLTEKFFARATVDVARDLLGATLQVRGDDGLTVSGRIVETEAYGGIDDPASHAAGGPTPRSQIMFGPPGLAYVYLIYGMHHCLNFVTEPDGTPGAVLIRALEPINGQRVMARRRNLDLDHFRPRDLCTGPGKLCQALALDRTWNGTAVTPDVPLSASTNSRLILLTASPSPVAWQTTPRIGLTKGKEALHRFCDPASTCLTR